MAEEKEQLKIEATLDTSQLKQDAKQGMQSVVNEEKKVENQSRQTSKAVDQIGQSGKNVGQALQQAGNQGTQALKKISTEAEKAKRSIASIDASVQNLKLGQAIGLVSQFANSGIGKGIGGYLGGQLGLSENDQGLAGAGIQGALSGAATGSMLAGPLGAAVGGLAGAGVGLMTAAQKQEEAAVALLKAADERQAANRDRTKEIDRQEAEAKKSKDFDEQFNALVAKGDFAGAQALIEKSRQEYQAQFELGDKGIRNSAIQMDATPLANRGAGYKSYDDYLRMRGAAQSGLGRMDAYEGRIKAAQAGLEQKAAQEAAKAAAEAEAARMKGLRSELGAANKERSSLSHELDSQLSSVRSRLSDNLTNIGGGRGYYSQNNGAVQSIDRTLRTKLASIDERIARITNDIENGSTAAEYQ